MNIKGKNSAHRVPFTHEMQSTIPEIKILAIWNTLIFHLSKVYVVSLSNLFYEKKMKDIISIAA